MIFSFLASKLGPRWILHILPYIIGAIALFAVYEKITQPTSNTTVGSGGKVVNVYQDSNTNKVPLGGCSIYRASINADWKKAGIIGK